MAAAQTYQSEFTGSQMDERFRAVATLAEALTVLEQAIAAKYTKPADGIPSTDMDASVQSALALALTSVQSLADYYTKSQVDSIAAAIAATVNATSGEVVASLPTASASTLGKIYYVGPTSGEYDRYITSYDGTTYSWLQIGSTDVDMTQYATVGELNQLDQKVSYKKGGDLPVNATSANWKLTGTGLSTGDNTAQLRKFQVTAGNVLYLKLSADTAGVYQFQKSASVPGSGTNANLVGEPVTTAVDGYVVVPETATYLIISELKTNTTNVVKSALPLELADIGSAEVLSGSAASGKILPSGIWASDSSLNVRKFAVKEGQMLYLKLSKDADVVYQWQNNGSIPSVAPNQYLIGLPVTTAADGFVFVPAGATYLMVVESTSNATNKVTATDKNSDIVDFLDRMAADTKAVNVDDMTVMNRSVNFSKKGVYITSSLTIESSTNWYMSDPFLVRKGQKVSITGKDTGNKTYLLVGVNSSTPISSTSDERIFKVITDLSPGNSSTEVTREWIATEDTYVIAQYSSLFSLLLGKPAIVPELADVWAKLADMQEQIGAELPAYVKAERDRVYDIIVDRSKGDVHIAAFNTDQHFDLDRLANPHSSYNPKWVMQGVAAMKDICDHIPVDEVVLGGDVAGYGGGTSADDEGIMLTVDYLFAPLVGIDSVLAGFPGNHDAYQNTTDVTAQGMHNVFAKRNQRHLYYKGNGADNCDAYVDDAVHKIRSIYVDTYSTNVRTENYRTFLAAALSSLPEGYKAVVYSHNALTNEFAGTVLAQKITDPTDEIDAFQNPSDCHEILNEYADKIIACICGHSHFDASAVSSAGILYIETTTAAPHTRNYTTDDIPNTSTLGTVTDTSFDFFVIDQAAQTIEAVRYGEGCNRKWKYKGVDAGMLPGYPQTIVRS